VHSCTAWLCFQKAGVTNDINFDLLHHMHALLLAFIARRQDAHATQRQVAEAEIGLTKTSQHKPQNL